MILSRAGSGPLNANSVPKYDTGPGLIPQLEVTNVKKMLLGYKKCNSRVDGDLPKDLVNPCAGKLAEALTVIYNACFLNKKWPTKWKIETIIPIPKSLSPGGFDDIRPISMTTVWSKILRTYVANFTMEETKKTGRTLSTVGEKDLAPTMFWWDYGTRSSLVWTQDPKQ